MPCIPKKCIGKKVRLTPKNNTMNWISLIILLKETPVKIGHQVVSPTIIVKTAPMLKT